MKSEIVNIIINSIKEINRELDQPILIDNQKEIFLYGGDSTLDSISLVSIIVLVEQEIEDKFDISLILADEKAMSRKNSPFLSVSTLADYIVELIEEEQENV
jgi:acyl carrier protein